LSCGDDRGMEKVGWPGIITLEEYLLIIEGDVASPTQNGKKGKERKSIVIVIQRA
jgi:hypothetical protein